VNVVDVSGVRLPKCASRIAGNVGVAEGAGGFTVVGGEGPGQRVDAGDRVTQLTQILVVIGERAGGWEQLSSRGRGNETVLKISESYRVDSNRADDALRCQTRVGLVIRVVFEKSDDVGIRSPIDRMGKVAVSFRGCKGVNLACLLQRSLFLALIREKEE
jgi:hypothetical protein